MQLFARRCLDTSCSDARYPRIGTKAANSEQYLLETQKKRAELAYVKTLASSQQFDSKALKLLLRANWTICTLCTELLEPCAAVATHSKSFAKQRTC